MMVDEAPARRPRSTRLSRAPIRHAHWLDELPQDYIDEAREALMNPEPNWPPGYRFDRVFSVPTTSARSFRRSSSSATSELTSADREFLTFAASVLVDT